MAGFDASVEALRATGSQLGQLAEELEGGYARLRFQVDGLLSGDWRGGAASGFEVGWEDWQTGFREAMSGLTGMAELLGATGATYEVSESGSTLVITESGATLL